jgi:hypothetical protein
MDVDEDEDFYAPEEGEQEASEHQQVATEPHSRPEKVEEDLEEGEEEDEDESEDGSDSVCASCRINWAFMLTYL